MRSTINRRRPGWPLGVLALGLASSPGINASLAQAEQPAALVHYWNFNDTGALLVPSYTVGGASLTADPGPTTVVTFGDGNGFTGENARMADDAGTHLRVDEPLGTTLTFNLPTTGFEDIVVRYETRRSTQGSGIQEIAYTTDGVAFTPFDEIVVFNEDPLVRTFDFTGVPGVDENPAFAVRITFAQGGGSTTGNNRFDNVTLAGQPTGTINSPPIVVDTPPLQEIIEQGSPAVLDLNTVFSDPDDDPLTFDAASSRPEVATAQVVGATLTITPHQRGDARIIIPAEDGHNPPVLTAFRVLVYPKAHDLTQDGFTFNAWDPNHPEHTFPEHMLFLQTDVTDPQVNAPLLFPYFIPHDDYHNDDSATIGFPYNNTARTRLSGLGEDGISFINTGRDRDLGGALLAVNTEGLTEVPVEWLAGTVLQNSRIYGLRLQYRVGATGPFLDVLDEGQPVEYVAGPDGETQPMGPVLLPTEALDQPYVQLLWRYHHIAVVSGPRAELRLDDIVVGTAPPEPQPRALVHYWNFNDTGALLVPSYTVGGASFAAVPGPLTVVTSGDGNGFTGENARMADDAGTHLRVNDPLGATLTLGLPTTGFEDVVVRYETRRSGQGAGIQEIAYTTDGVAFNPFDEIVVFNDDPVVRTLDFTGVPGVDENPAFAVQITFAQGTGGLAGNNRFDNVTLDGRPTGTINSPPIVVDAPPLQEIIEQDAPAVLDLHTVFSDPDDDPLTFIASSTRTAVAAVAVDDDLLTITPLQRGDTQVTVEAYDGHNPPVLTAFRVLVYPRAHDLAAGVFAFDAWDPDQPEYTYPEHMIFLQTDVTDPQVNAPLLFPYVVPHDDYHDDDGATVGFPYNNTRRTRLNGLGEDGISFINTGRDRDLGGALLAVGTEGLAAVPVAWLAGTVLENERVYGLRLQYRVGATGPFLDVLDDNQPVEYVAGPDGETQPMGPVLLPTEALDQPYVQLLWRYHHIAVTSGPRAELRLDDLLVGVPDIPGDFDGDGDVDDADFLIFQACYSGPAVPYDPNDLPPGCALEPDQDDVIPADFNRDGIVDHHDFAAFQRCYSGQNIPGDPHCAD